jgi:hypothetical protein
MKSFNRTLAQPQSLGGGGQGLKKLFSTSVKRDITGGRNELAIQKLLPPPSLG